MRRIGAHNNGHLVRITFKMPFGCGTIRLLSLTLPVSRDCQLKVLHNYKHYPIFDTRCQANGTKNESWSEPRLVALLLPDSPLVCYKDCSLFIRVKELGFDNV